MCYTSRDIIRYFSTVASEDPVLIIINDDRIIDIVVDNIYIYFYLIPVARIVLLNNKFCRSTKINIQVSETLVTVAIGTVWETWQRACIVVWDCIVCLCGDVCSVGHHSVVGQRVYIVHRVWCSGIACVLCVGRCSLLLYETLQPVVVCVVWWDEPTGGGSVRDGG